ncbi:GmrSD restriction endonuclease domain-containing protein [Clostridium botulinum]|uniref:GmrSD restriction endonuclease domain-containing protein n=1 Tax=Clostridium botulinum TaxID=1491 RepID=UPI00068E2E23|nr:DUF262 domain-containing protein [Clostridium botulinum]MCD3233282.1 DUF262 domain-containing protein [Clostridium botulinum D/C]MCD3239031.1 DUF262 domain-containing protein [Clostridium botulinum D/C]MCD3266701.1 DUF262 domain-containing protein [Clostridium botulinum D/C]MCD3299593.1 DUF262 domain-containing protein [Clostridium botulinum D/C]MCD3304940.1 DUF262 domain-containing protein [Clostridium botulinum D/C]
MKLNTRWKELRNTANTENVLMTVSEIIKFYERGRIKINPAYQRNYRWSNEQKTKFIESLLLKYPIPPIITIKTENDNGLYNYEIIDGVQRLSTIFEFVGAKSIDGESIKNKVECLNKLVGASGFIEINGKNWKEFQEEQFDFIFESSTLLFINLMTENEDVKYEMFERLNTLSTELSPQEIRNSIIAFKDKDKYIEISNIISELSKPIFSVADLGKRIDLEYFIEFSLIKRYEEYIELINKKTKDIIKSKSKNKNKHFDILLSSYVRLVKIDELVEDIDDYKQFLSLNQKLYFKKYNCDKKKTEGNPIKFFFELLSFLYFKNKSVIKEEVYKINFSENYADIVKNKYGKNNPNAKLRFELARKIISEYSNGNRIFND